jgi:hypothetical protein
MVMWTLATLGFRALLADVACGGAICDQMRADTDFWRILLLAAWVTGMAVGTAVLVALWRRSRA